MDIDTTEEAQAAGIHDILTSLGHHVPVDGVGDGEHDEQIGSGITGAPNTGKPTGPDPTDATVLSELDNYTLNQLKQEILRLRKENRKLTETNTALAVAAATIATSNTTRVTTSNNNNNSATTSTSGPNSIVIDPSLQDISTGNTLIDSSTFSAADLAVSETISAAAIAAVANARGNNHSVVSGTGKSKGKRRGDDLVDGVGGRKKKKGESAGRNEETGKRLEKGRRTEVSKALRMRMKAAMNISPDDPLPPPSTNPDGSIKVPDWSQPQNQENLDWVEKHVQHVFGEAIAGNYPRIPNEDIDLDIFRMTARTAFTNFAKKYVVENNPVLREKKERYMKGRRRWARKDLKQERRLKASQDPSLLDIDIPPNVFHLDYMSSEYSSPGSTDEMDIIPSDTFGIPQDELRIKEEAKRRRVEEWERQVREHSSNPGGEGGKGWAKGLGEKVLEVRTPRWRSSRLNAIYERLDQIMVAHVHSRQTGNTDSQDADPIDTPGGSQTREAPRGGHIAPSHNRFKLPSQYRRSGAKPREIGQDWMWQSGQAGVWPSFPTSTDIPAGEDNQHDQIHHSHDGHSGHDDPGGMTGLEGIEWDEAALRLADAIDLGPHP